MRRAAFAFFLILFYSVTSFASGAELFFFGKAASGGAGQTFAVENARVTSGTTTSTTLTLSNASCTSSGVPFSWCTGSGTGTAPTIAAGDTLVVGVSYTDAATISVSDGDSFTMRPVANTSWGNQYVQWGYVLSASTTGTPTFTVSASASPGTIHIYLWHLRKSGGTVSFDKDDDAGVGSGNTSPATSGSVTLTGTGGEFISGLTADVSGAVGTTLTIAGSAVTDSTNSLTKVANFYSAAWWKTYSTAPTGSINATSNDTAGNYWVTSIFSLKVQ